MSDEVQKPATESFKELKARLAEEQRGKTKADILEEYGGIDLDNLPKHQHHWVKRGIVMSCEGMDHPNHRHFLVRR